MHPHVAEAKRGGRFELPVRHGSALLPKIPLVRPAQPHSPDAKNIPLPVAPSHSGHSHRIALALAVPSGARGEVRTPRAMPEQNRASHDVGTAQTCNVQPYPADWPANERTFND